MHFIVRGYILAIKKRVNNVAVTTAVLKSAQIYSKDYLIFK